MKTIFLPVNKLKLDVENFRIETHSGYSQEKIRELLIETEEVIKLANDIVKDEPPLLNERVAVLKQGTKYVVIEGNRRVCASQILVNPELLKVQLRNKLPNLSEHLKSKLSKIETLVLDNREQADAYIARRHTTKSVRSWNTSAKQRWIASFYKKHSDIGLIAHRLRMSKSAVSEYLRNYYLMEQVKNLDGWSRKEQKELNDLKLKTNPFTRFFRQEGVKEKLKMEFGENYELRTTMKKENFEKTLKFLAKNYLLKNEDGSKRYNTRTDSRVVFKDLIGEVGGLKGELDSRDLREITVFESSAPKKNLKPDVFFKNFKSPDKDNVLKRIVWEITNINYGWYPLSASYLLRALIERVLYLLIRRNDLIEELNALKGAAEYANLDQQFKVCEDNSSSIFNGDRRSQMGQMKKVKTYCNNVIHGKIEADSRELETQAKLVRTFLEEVLDGTALRKKT